MEIVSGIEGIELTEGQHNLVRPLLDKADDEHKKGKAGMVIAQIWEDVSGGAFMQIGFLDSDESILLLESMGVDWEEREARKKKREEKEIIIWKAE